MILNNSNKIQALLKIVLACTLGLFFAPYLAHDYFYGTTISVSSLLLIFSVGMLFAFLFTAYQERREPRLLDIFLIGMVTLMIAAGTGSLNNLLFNLQYGHEIKGDINVTSVKACRDNSNRAVPYAIHQDKMVVLCPQSKHLTGLFYKTEKIAVPTWLASDHPVSSDQK